MRRETTALRQEAQDLGLWLVLGSAHFLDERTKPTNCLYLIDPQGRIVNRYDKCMCTGGDQKHYSAGNRLVAHDIRGVRIGLAICYDICWPQMYMAYRAQGVTLSPGPTPRSPSNWRSTSLECCSMTFRTVCPREAGFTMSSR